MTNEKKPMTLAQKLAKIGKEIGAVSKSGTNLQQKYNYIEYGVVAGRIRELFDTYSIIIVPSVSDYQTDEITTKNGASGYHYVLRMSFKLINGDDPNDTLETTWLGESADYGDKGINKAETSGTKYFLMRLFNVSEKGEEEADKITPEIARSKRITATRSQFTEAEIENAKNELEDAENFEDLKIRFARIGKIRNLPEIIRLKDELKEAFISNDPDAAKSNAKDLLSEQFKK